VITYGTEKGGPYETFDNTNASPPNATEPLLARLVIFVQPMRAGLSNRTRISRRINGTLVDARRPPVLVQSSRRTFPVHALPCQVVDKARDIPSKMSRLPSPLPSPPPSRRHCAACKEHVSRVSRHSGGLHFVRRRRRTGVSQRASARYHVRFEITPAPRRVFSTRVPSRERNASPRNHRRAALLRLMFLARS